MTKQKAPTTSKALALFCTKILQDKLAEDIVILELTDIESSPAEFFVICSSNSDPQSLAIVDELLQKTKQVGLTRPRVEGLNNAEWILLDYFDVVVHVMLKPIRSFYKIEKLWADAKFYKFNAETEKLNKLKPTDTVKILNSI